VISESPAAGTNVNGGSAVNLVVSTGQALLSLAVTPVNPTVAPGSTQQFTAMGTYSGNVTVNVTNLVTWSSSTGAVATISSGGLASGQRVGTTTISAMLGQVSGSMVLTVTNLAQCSSNPHGNYTVADVQVMVNEGLGESPPANDLKGSGAINVSDTQIAVNAALGMGCITH
jgi:hypothetical protein